MADLNITERKRDSVTILDLRGDIRLSGGNALLHDTLRSLVDRGEKRVLLNLAEVDHIDSVGLGEIVSSYTTMQRNSGEMKLVHLTNRVSELMMITKLLTVFDVYESEDEAVASFGGEASTVGA